MGKKRFIEGVVSINKAGFGFLTTDDEEVDDIYISKAKLNDAMDKDRVKIEITRDKTDGHKAEGRVIKVLERNNSILIGVFQKVKDYGFVILDGKKSNYDIFIPKDKTNGAKDGDKVIVAIDYFKKKDKNPTGYIKEVLGSINDLGIEILSIAKRFELPDTFSRESIDYVNSLDDRVKIEDYKGRYDLRELFTVTIDGRDSKDFDDAISIEKRSDGYMLYVHIADVAHYVKEKSSLDKDAYERGNSVYLLDRVIPMLPEKLSNVLCSLNPNEDRLAVTVKMLINRKGKVVDYNFYESIINSNYRLIYEDVSNYLEGKANIYGDDLLLENLRNMEELSEILEEKKIRKGCIDFNFKESEIKLDKLGRVVDIGISERRIANKLIENFMVITNEVVGGHFANISVPFLYRVHEKPSEEKLAEFRKIIGKFGIVIKGQDVYPKDMQKVLLDVENTPIELLINNLMLRSMKKAEYRREANIHFGLATENYSHFTAPIRRYSDLVIHRILKASIHNNYRKVKKTYLNKLDRIAEHVSRTERKAEEAERDVESLKKAEFMLNKIGQVFTGTISSLTSFGIFVELDNTVEGLIHFRNLDDDYYEFDEENYLVRASGSSKIYEIGQKIKVKLEDVNLELREIDFRMVIDDEG